jgi:hypothetical protein
MMPKNVYKGESSISVSKDLAKKVLVPEPIATVQSEPITYDYSTDDASKTITNEGGNKKIILFSVIGFAVLAIAVTGYFAFKNNKL